MAVPDRIREEMKRALKEGAKEKVSILRYALSALQNKEKELGRSLEDGEAYQVLRTLIKKGREAAEKFRQGGREDLARKEEEEIGILESFLPKPLSEEELGRIIDQAIREVQAQGPRDLGKVMKVVMPQVAGRAEGQVVNALVKRKLEALSP